MISDAITLRMTLLAPPAEVLENGGVHVVSQAVGLEDALNLTEARSKYCKWSDTTI